MAMEPRSLPMLSISAKAAGQGGRYMSYSGKSFLYYYQVCAALDLLEQLGSGFDVNECLYYKRCP